MENNTYQTNNAFGANPNEPSSGKIDFEDLRFLVWRKYQNFIDRTTVYPKERWIVLLIISLFYALRIYITQGEQIYCFINNNRLCSSYILIRIIFLKLSDVILITLRRS